MSTKKENTTVETSGVIDLEPVKKTLIKMDLVGASELILHRKARSFERQEIWKQSHPKGDVMPNEFNQPYNMWEKLITSLNWEKPITYHDEDYSLYTKEEWEFYMNPENNAPCIMSEAIRGSLIEAFVSFGYKDRLSKNGTDLKRGISFSKTKFPITFVTAQYEQQLIPNNSRNAVNVLSEHNVFIGWKCPIEIVVADSAFTPKSLIEIILTAGKFIGLHSQRKNGYGRFDLENIQMIDVTA